VACPADGDVEDARERGEPWWPDGEEIGGAYLHEQIGEVWRRR
jgi:hypothetical protein